MKYTIFVIRRQRSRRFWLALMVWAVALMGMLLLAYCNPAAAHAVTVCCAVLV